MPLTTIIFITDRLLNFYNVAFLRKHKDWRCVLLTHCDYPEQDWLTVHQVETVTEENSSILSEKDLERYLRLEYELNPRCCIICNDDVNLPTINKVKKNLKLTALSDETLEIFTDKVCMKKHLLAAGINVPKFLPFDASLFQAQPETYYQTLVEKLGEPFVLKPRSAAASTGYIKLSTSAAFMALKDNHQPILANYEAETFISGTLYHCDSLIQNRRILIQKISVYSRPMGDFLAGFPIFSHSLSPDHLHYDAMQAFSEQILEAFNFPEGASHLEFFRTPAGELIFLEIALRAPGGLAVPAYEKQFGFNFLDEDLKIKTGQPVSLSSSNQNIHAAWGLYPKQHGTMKRNQLPAIQSNFNLSWHCADGELTQASTSLSQRAASILLWAPDRYIVNQDLHHLAQWQPYAHAS